MHALLSDPGGVLRTRPIAPRTAAFRPLETVGVLLDTTVRSILLSTTILISGLNHTACILATPGSVHPIAGIARGFAPDLLARLSSGGIGAILARTHWVTTTSFMGSLPIPRFWASLGTTSARLGARLGTEPRLAFSCLRCVGAGHSNSSLTPVFRFRRARAPAPQRSHPLRITTAR